MPKLPHDRQHSHSPRPGSPAGGGGSVDAESGNGEDPDRPQLKKRPSFAVRHFVLHLKKHQIDGSMREAAKYRGRKGASKVFILCFPPPPSENR